jgi:hypothetical protein
LKGTRTIAKASNNSSHDQVSQAESRALQDGADDHDRRAQKDHFPSAEDITNKDGDNSTNEAADIVTGD